MPDQSHTERLKAKTALPSAEAMLAEWKQGDTNFAALCKAAGQNHTNEADNFQRQLQSTVETFRALAAVLTKKPAVVTQLASLLAARREAYIIDTLALHNELIDNPSLPPIVKASYYMTANADSSLYLLPRTAITDIIESNDSLRRDAALHNVAVQNKGNQLADTLADINGQAEALEKQYNLPQHSAQAFLALDNSRFFTALTRAARPFEPHTLTDLLDNGTITVQFNKLIEEVRLDPLMPHKSRAHIFSGKGLGRQ